MLLNCGVGKDSWESLDARRANQSILKEISPECSLRGLMLKLKFQYFGHLMQRADLSWERLKAEGEGTTEDEMVGWHHRLNGHGFVWTLGVGDGQGGLACCSPWGFAKSWTWLSYCPELNWMYMFPYYSFNLSHPLLPSLCSKVCSLGLHLSSS